MSKRCQTGQNVVTTANDTKNIPVTKHRSDGAKAWKGLPGVMSMDYETQKKKKKRRGQREAVQDLNEDASAIIVVCGPARSLGLQVPAPKMKVLRPTSHFNPKWQGDAMHRCCLWRQSWSVHSEEVHCLMLGIRE